MNWENPNKKRKYRTAATSPDLGNEALIERMQLLRTDELRQDLERGMDDIRARMCDIESDFDKGMNKVMFGEVQEQIEKALKTRFKQAKQEEAIDRQLAEEHYKAAHIAKQIKALSDELTVINERIAELMNKETAVNDHNPPVVPASEHQTINYAPDSWQARFDKMMQRSMLP